MYSELLPSDCHILQSERSSGAPSSLTWLIPFNDVLKALERQTWVCRMSLVSPQHRAEVRKRCFITCCAFSMWPNPQRKHGFLIIEKREIRLDETKSQNCFSTDSKELWNPDKLVGPFFFLSTSEIGKQVIWRISLDFGSLRIKFSYLVSQKAERALFTSDFLWRSVCLFGSNAHVWKVHNKMKVLVNGLVF